MYVSVLLCVLEHACLHVCMPVCALVSMCVCVCVWICTVHAHTCGSMFTVLIVCTYVSTVRVCE